MLDSDCWNSKESIRIIVCSKMRIFPPIYMDLSIGLSLKKCVLKFRTADIRFFLASKRARIPSDWNSLTIILNTLSLSLRLYKSNIKQRFCLSTRRIYIILRNALVQFVNLTFLRISDLIIYNVQSHGQNYFHVCYMSSTINVIRLRIVLLSKATYNNVAYFK